MSTTLAELVLSQWEAMNKLPAPIVIDGGTLDMATAAAFGKYGGSVSLSNESNVRERIQSCVDVLSRQLQEGRTVYGKE